MKASLDKDGCLTITPESGVEAYALKCWQNNYRKGASTLLTEPDQENTREIMPGDRVMVKENNLGLQAGKWHTVANILDQETGLKGRCIELFGHPRKLYSESIFTK